MQGDAAAPGIEIGETAIVCDIKPEQSGFWRRQPPVQWRLRGGDEGRPCL